MLAAAAEDPLATLALVVDAADEASARIAVQEHFGVGPVEAQAVLDMQFRRANRHGRAAIARDRDEHAAILSESAPARRAARGGHGPLRRPCRVVRRQRDAPRPR
ncbi:hypothetical protein G5V59_13275 [Nocardioides sp. W3-2-3]|uniref:hypothetical protein n=1 Tax=Nocardioides convexus TaxID=2712224 RepID=UPI0024181FA0|nr:hypothetical protein [Nocardioides convexus]NHA00664.1 hypothetical protein [Nocardioides convexus]